MKAIRSWGQILVNTMFNLEAISSNKKSIKCFWKIFNAIYKYYNTKIHSL